jgi:hypothetical protein
MYFSSSCTCEFFAAIYPGDDGGGCTGGVELPPNPNDAKEAPKCATDGSVTDVDAVDIADPVDDVTFGTTVADDGAGGTTGAGVIDDPPPAGPPPPPAGDATKAGGLGGNPAPDPAPAAAFANEGVTAMDFLGFRFTNRINIRGLFLNLIYVVAYCMTCGVLGQLSVMGMTYLQRNDREIEDIVHHFVHFVFAF